LRVLIEKYNLKSNSKVITPVAGFPTTVNPIIQCGLTPLFVDIELPSLNYDSRGCIQSKQKGNDNAPRGW
jgi:CDP-6-deoxy-D-xylo-4-hexulose-3-dehydrase